MGSSPVRVTKDPPRVSAEDLCFFWFPAKPDAKKQENALGALLFLAEWEGFEPSVRF